MSVLLARSDGEHDGTAALFTLRSSMTHVGDVNRLRDAQKLENVYGVDPGVAT
jgi:hypothetical protein